MSAGVALAAVLPRSEPAELFVPEGDPAGLDRWAGVLLEAAGRFDELADEARQLGRLDGWEGDSSQTYAAATGRSSARAERVGTTARRVARVVLACADRLRRHQWAHAEHVDRKARLDRRLAELTARASAGEVSPGQSAVLQQQADALTQAYRRLVHDDRRLRRLVEADEDLLAAALRSADTTEEALDPAGGRPDLAAAAMRRPGAPGPDASPDQVRRWWQELSGQERRAVTASYAHWIADTEGVPADARERADRVRDEEVLVRLRAKEADGTLDAGETERLARLEQQAPTRARGDGR